MRQVKLLDYDENFSNTNNIIYYDYNKLYVKTNLMTYDTIKLLDEYSSEIKILEINLKNIIGLLDLSKFKKLKKLDYSFNNIFKISNIPETLEWINISYNLLENICGLELPNNLKYLNLSNNNLIN